MDSPILSLFFNEEPGLKVSGRDDGIEERNFFRIGAAKISSLRAKSEYQGCRARYFSGSMAILFARHRRFSAGVDGL
jgi:hypothetical protein